MQNCAKNFESAEPENVKKQKAHAELEIQAAMCKNQTPGALNATFFMKKVEQTDRKNRKSLFLTSESEYFETLRYKNDLLSDAGKHHQQIVF